MLEILRQFLEYARFELTDIRFGIFIYLARHVSDLFSGAFKNDEHILLGISSLAKLGDARVFLIAEALYGQIYFIKKDDVVFGEWFAFFIFLYKTRHIFHIRFAFIIFIGFASEFF